MKVGLFVAAGLAVALALAFFVSPLASSEPDGLEKVAADQGFSDQADDHALADLPTADYGGDDPRLPGVLGVLATFVVAGGVFALVGRAGRST